MRRPHSGRSRGTALGPRVEAKISTSVSGASGAASLLRGRGVPAAGWQRRRRSGCAADTRRPGQATRVVEGLHEVMLGVMKQAKQLGYEGRLAQLQPAIASRYDFAFIAEKSVGLTWKELDAAQRAKLVDALGTSRRRQLRRAHGRFQRRALRDDRHRERQSGHDPRAHARRGRGRASRFRSTTGCAARPNSARASSTCSTTARSASWRCAVRSTQRCSRRAASTRCWKRSRRRSRSRRPPAPRSEHALRARRTRDRVPRAPALRASAGRRCARRRRSRSSPRAARAVPRAGCRAR